MVATNLSMQAMQAISAKYFFYITLAHFIPGGNKRLRMLNQSVSMCDLLLPTCFKGPNVIASQRCDSVLGFTVKVLRN